MHHLMPELGKHLSHSLFIGSHQKSLSANSVIAHMRATIMNSPLHMAKEQPEGAKHAKNLISSMRKFTPALVGLTSQPASAEHTI